MEDGHTMRGLPENDLLFTHGEDKLREAFFIGVINGEPHVYQKQDKQAVEQTWYAQ